jgi:hypothetical protein
MKSKKRTRGSKSRPALELAGYQGHVIFFIILEKIPFSLELFQVRSTIYEKVIYPWRGNTCILDGLEIRESRVMWYARGKSANVADLCRSSRYPHSRFFVACLSGRVCFQQTLSFFVGLEESFSKS